MKEAESNNSFAFPWGPVAGLLFGFFAASDNRIEFEPGLVVFCIGLGALLQAAFDQVNSVQQIGTWLLFTLGGMVLMTMGMTWAPAIAMSIVFAALAFTQGDRKRY